MRNWGTQLLTWELLKTLTLVVGTGIVTSLAGVLLLQQNPITFFPGTMGQLYRWLLLFTLGTLPAIAYQAETPYTKVVVLYQLTLVTLLPGLVLMTRFSVSVWDVAGLCTGLVVGGALLRFGSHVVDPVVPVWLVMVVTYSVTVFGLVRATTSPKVSTGTITSTVIPTLLYTTLLIVITYRAFISERASHSHNTATARKA